MSAKKGMSAEDLKKAMVAKRDLEALHRHLEYVEQDIRRAEAELHELQQKKQVALQRIAEAEAALGNDAAARQSLKAILDHRIPDTSYLDALSGADLQDEVYLQTRIELWGEGKSYLAMKRLRKTITRGSNWLDYAGQSFDYNDERLTFEIPEIEIRNNPNISEQNP